VIISIDGPSASGKSTVARKLARTLGFIHLNTGAFFRALGLKAQRLGVHLDDDAALAALVKETSFELVADENAEGGAQLLVDGESVAAETRSAEAGSIASQIAVLPRLRAALLEAQREAARGKSVVVEGRDTGTVAFPEAELKIFLNAKLRVRTERRFNELQERNSLGTHTLDSLGVELEERDHRDTHREVAPLLKAKDATEIDTSQMSADDVVKQIALKVRAFVA
jgi:cytidylate kinase